MVVVFNWLLNPFLLFDSPEIDGINKLKTEIFFANQLTKPHTIKQQKPHSIILGTSRAGSSLNPSSPQLNAMNIYNLATPGASPYVIFRLYQHAMANAEIKSVILCIDFFMFNDARGNKLPGYDKSFESRLDTLVDDSPATTWPQYLRDDIVTLTSWSTIQSSWATLNKQKSFASQEKGGVLQQKNGFWIQQQPKSSLYPNIFSKTAETYFSQQWFVGDKKEFRLSPIDGDDTTTFYYFRQLLLELYKHDIETKIVILPPHAYLLEALSVAGLWDEFEEWKKRLIIINDQQALLFNKAPYNLWDFAGFNNISEEPIPASSTGDHPMQWYIDAAHPNAAAGEIVIAKIFGAPIKNSNLDNFGRQLTSESIDAHLEQIRHERQLYRDQHPQLLADLKHLYQSFINKK